MPVDLRAHSPVQLAAPHPLPFVSRKALSRVKDFKPAPACCPNCGAAVHLVSNAEIYGREYGDWPYAYLCETKCSYVGLHPQTDLPLGTLADRDVREARKKAKAVFFQVKARTGWSRNECYGWLASEMCLPKSETHFGFFDAQFCANAQAHCEAFLAKLESKK